MESRIKEFDVNKHPAYRAGPSAYGLGYSRCTSCEVYMKTASYRCFCCNTPLRKKARSRRSKNKKSYQEKRKQMWDQLELKQKQERLENEMRKKEEERIVVLISNRKNYLKGYKSAGR
jgi:hypothetical protein